jgi:xylulokinase
MRPLAAGIDIGTNATKCIICDLQGQVIAQSRHDHELCYPRKGWAEQDAEELWQAALAALREAVSKAKAAGRVVVLSLSTQGGTTIPVDALGRPLRPAISWLDARGEAEGREIAELLGQEAIYRATGFQASAHLPLVHILWLRRHEPSTYAGASRYLFVNDWAIFRLTGRFRMDPSNAALTMLYNVEQGCWDESLCRAAGVQPDQLSPVEDSGQPVGTLLPEVAKSAGLTPDVLVVNGGHDQYCAALGAGVISPGDVLLSCGTAWVLVAVTDCLLWDPERIFAPARHVVSGRWGLLSSLPAAGASMDWLISNLLVGPGESKPGYELIDSHLKDPEPGARGLLCLPLFAGIEAATRDSRVWGTFTGLTLAHSRWDLVQSLMEGVALELRWVLEKLGALGCQPRCLRMVGGAARSGVWPQITADATGMPLLLPDVTEAAARGAAMLAAIGAGLLPSDATASGWWREGKCFQPRAEREAAYRQLFGRYKALHRALSQIVEE